MNCINTLAAVMSIVLCVFFSFYPGPDPLNVSQSGQPLRSVCVRGVGSILVHQRGHLQGGKKCSEDLVRVIFWKKRAGLTFAWRAICLTKRGRFRSETIFVTVVSTKPSRSEKEEKGTKKRS